jgi:hypothetical protein
MDPCSSGERAEYGRLRSVAGFTIPFLVESLGKKVISHTLDAEQDPSRPRKGGIAEQSTYAFMEAILALEAGEERFDDARIAEMAFSRLK